MVNWHKFFTSILDTISDGVFISDAMGTTLYVNQMYADLVGVPARDLRGKNVRDLVSEGFFDLALNPEVVRTGKPATYMQKLKDGKNVVISGSPVFDDKGRVCLVVTFVRDETRLAELNEQTGEQRKLIKEINDKLAFVAQSQGRDLEPVFASSAMQSVAMELKRYASTDATVLIMGETGVGKELFARTLYRNSHRASRPFVAVDCASLPETLVESHLFGHARGAFTGAERASEGLLRAAHQGTLFLDEVGELPLPVQGAFLRALELRRFRPVGEVREVESDFRLVAATNQDLEAMSEDGRFRKDLLYRLQGMTIVIPPLRRRRDEIPLLARQAVIRCCRRNGMEEKELSPLLLEMLAEYDWPGNVRELFHTLERACLAAEHASLLLPAHLATGLRVAVARSRAGQGRVAGDVPGGREVCPPLAEAGACSVPDLPPMPETGRAFPSLRSWRHEAERHYVARVRALCGDDARAAARMAGVSRGHWYELLKKYGF